jgi:hypothetical protein
MHPTSAVTGTPSAGGESSTAPAAGEDPGAVDIIGVVSGNRLRATLVEGDDRWIGRLRGTEFTARTRQACLTKLRRAAGEDVALTVEVMPALVGVAEAGAILGWDKRRVITYVDRGSFPEPVARLASGRVWRREDVEVFARARRHKQTHRGVP